MHKVLVVALSLFFIDQASALPEGSPNRCKGKDWSKIDDLLPVRSENGGYSPALDPAKQKLADVKPEVMLQSVVDHLLTFYDLCGQPVAGRGGWEDLIGTNLCERMALYNVFHNGIMSGDSSTESKDSHFSPDDLSFLQSIFKMCRPSTNRWWDYPLVEHVTFHPTPEEYQELGHKLGVSK